MTVLKVAKGTPLTHREYEILVLIAGGLTNRQIGSRLFIGYATVATHVRVMLRKMGATSRAHAVHLGHRRGLL